MFKLPEGWGVVKPWDRHSLILIAAGLGYILAGILYLIDLRTPEQERALYYAAALMPISYWSVVFIIVGAIAFVSARWPAWPKSLGYTVLTGLSAAWSGFYLMGLIQTNWDVANLSSALLWALVAFLWWGISGLVSPREVGEA